MTPEQRAADLLSRGYREVTAWEALSVGQRVRHTSHRWSGAYDHGTGTIAHIFHHPDSAWSLKYSAPDVELIVRRDDGDYAYWANYHIVTVRTDS